MRPSRVALWFATASAVMAVVFLALGHFSDEPLDHPYWLMAGYWPVVFCYTVLIGFCLPCLCLYGLLLYSLRLCGLIPGPDAYNPLGQWCFVAYPLLQGAIYGGAAWMLTLVGNAVRRILPRRRTLRGSPSDYGEDRPLENGSEVGASRSVTPQAGAGAPWRACRKLLAILAPLVILSIASRFVLLPTLPSTWRVDFDRNRYVEIHDAIKADKSHLLGKSFDEVSKRFGLESVPWDDASFQGPNGSYRIYHFRGFAFYVTVGLELPDDSPLRKGGGYTGEDLRRYGVLRLADQYPFVRVDGINDPKERMKRHWDAIHQACARINAEMGRERHRTGR
jgi:hypothetical protein